MKSFVRMVPPGYVGSVRCPNCNQRLFDESDPVGGGVIETKCTVCKNIVKIIFQGKAS